MARYLLQLMLLTRCLFLGCAYSAKYVNVRIYPNVDRINSKIMKCGKTLEEREDDNT